MWRYDYGDVAVTIAAAVLMMAVAIMVKVILMELLLPSVKRTCALFVVPSQCLSASPNIESPCLFAFVNLVLSCSSSRRVKSRRPSYTAQCKTVLPASHPQTPAVTTAHSTKSGLWASLYTPSEHRFVQVRATYCGERQAGGAKNASIP